MKNTDYLKYLVEQIHSTVMATVDKDGRPVTAAIDMMDQDERGLYFLTARGKSLYDRLVGNPYLALTGMKIVDNGAQHDDGRHKTMSTIAVSIRGKAVELGPELLSRLFEKNPYMKDIYPTEESRKALTVFCITEGTGEWFDLSRLPIQRADFAFGGAKEQLEGYQITDTCTGCGSCQPVCPQNCIFLVSGKAAIQQEHCLHCGSCAEVCPAGAVITL